MSNTTTLDNWRFFGITFSYCIQGLLVISFASLLLDPSLLLPLFAMLRRDFCTLSTEWSQATFVNEMFSFLICKWVPKMKLLFETHIEDCCLWWYVLRIVVLHNWVVDFRPLIQTVCWSVTIHLSHLSPWVSLFDSVFSLYSIALAISCDMHCCPLYH